MICETLKTKTVFSNYSLWWLSELEMYGNCSCNVIYLERKFNLLCLKKYMLPNKHRIKIQNRDIYGICVSSVTICTDGHLWIFNLCNKLWSTDYILLSFLFYSVCPLKASDLCLEPISAFAKQDSIIRESSQWTGFRVSALHFCAYTWVHIMSTIINYSYF